MIDIRSISNLIDYVEYKLDESDLEAKTNSVRLSHDDVFDEVRKSISLLK